MNTRHPLSHQFQGANPNSYECFARCKGQAESNDDECQFGVDEMDSW